VTKLPRPLPRASAVWLGITGGASLLDWYLDQGEPDHDTLSECTRRLFYTHTPLGKAVLAATMAVGGDVLYRHLCKVV